jgi:preprotein translocase subunit SecG
MVTVMVMVIVIVIVMVMMEMVQKEQGGETTGNEKDEGRESKLET